MQTGEHPTTDPQRRPPPCPRAFTPTPPPFPTDGGTCTTTCARRAHSAEAGGGAAGLGFSEAVAQTANRRRGDGSAKIKVDGDASLKDDSRTVQILVIHHAWGTRGVSFIIRGVPAVGIHSRAYFSIGITVSDT